MTEQRRESGAAVSAATLGWSQARGLGRRGGVRGVLERMVARGYGAAYDAIVDGFPPYEALLDEVASFVNCSRSGSASLRVLDVTCGPGTVAARLARDGHAVVGLEPVEHLVDVARRRHGAGSAANPTFLHLDVAQDQV